MNKTASTIEGTNKHTEDQSSLQKEVIKAAEKETSGFTFSEKRSIRVFISSTFRDMIEDRNELIDAQLAGTAEILCRKVC